jgi:hypothetical protein
MPYRDPEKHRANARKWASKNREKVNARSRAQYWSYREHGFFFRKSGDRRQWILPEKEGDNK